MSAVLIIVITAVKTQLAHSNALVGVVTTWLEIIDVLVSNVVIVSVSLMFPVVK